ncbi:unnamed protein product [Cladocopium goreaui]|uniref:Uncharacterized protein n=1 Tax=Cladocopium goreaui TaxID=2562237 RepID=A0A9P1G0X0_9DINO|nr:unnamed protein product [Cladocopium goreaui]
MSRQRGPDSQSSEDAGGACSVQVSLRHIVQDGAKGKPWTPTCIQKMDACFAKCSKFDRGFVMFTLERNMLTTSKKSSKEPVSCNLPSFNSLLRARRETSIKCAQDALEVEEMETDDTPQMKKRKIKSSHEALVNPVISIPFPECGDWPERQVNVLWGVKSSDLWVELTPANMKHLKCILKTEMEKGEVTCKKKASPKKKRASPKKSPRRRLRRSTPLAESPMADGEQVEETLVDSDHAEMMAETLEYVEG